ncbi:MAG: helix-turn-helix transcriptional regulator [Alphaproteobacteria bacterium]|nr:helix-turn-helix transcriptional regulator [Alphaproteobacteria bacterium]
MDQKIIFEYISTHCNEIDNYLTPLKEFNITYFSFSRVYKEGKIIFFCSDQSWLSIKFNNQLFDYRGFFPAESQMIEHNYDQHFYTGTYDPNNSLLKILYEANIWNSLDIYDRKEDYIDIAHFASSRDNIKIVNFYMNNIIFLKDFFRFFKKVFEKKIFLFYEKYDLSLLSFCQSEKNIGDIVNNKLFHSSLTQTELELLSHQNLKKIPFFINSKSVALTSREIECLFYLSRGKTKKEIGRLVGLSPRTVESYLNNIKYKTHAFDKSNLIDAFYLNAEIPSSFQEIIKNLENKF